MSSSSVGAGPLYPHFVKTSSSVVGSLKLLTPYLFLYISRVDLQVHALTTEAVLSSTAVSLSNPKISLEHNLAKVSFRLIAKCS